MTAFKNVFVLATVVVLWAATTAVNAELSTECAVTINAATGHMSCADCRARSPHKYFTLDADTEMCYEVARCDRDTTKFAVDKLTQLVTREWIQSDPSQDADADFYRWVVQWRGYTVEQLLEDDELRVDLAYKIFCGKPDVQEGFEIVGKPGLTHFSGGLAFQSSIDPTHATVIPERAPVGCLHETKMLVDVRTGQLPKGLPNLSARDHKEICTRLIEQGAIPRPANNNNKGDVKANGAGDEEENAQIVLVDCLSSPAIRGMEHDLKVGLNGLKQRINAVHPKDPVYCPSYKTPIPVAFDESNTFEYVVPNDGGGHCTISATIQIRPVDLSNPLDPVGAFSHSRVFSLSEHAEFTEQVKNVKITYGAVLKYEESCSSTNPAVVYQCVFQNQFPGIYHIWEVDARSTRYVLPAQDETELWRLHYDTEEQWYSYVFDGEHSSRCPDLYKFHVTNHVRGGVSAEEPRCGPVEFITLNAMLLTSSFVDGSDGNTAETMVVGEMYDTKEFERPILADRHSLQYELIIRDQDAPAPANQFEIDDEFSLRVWDTATTRAAGYVPSIRPMRREDFRQSFVPVPGASSTFIEGAMCMGHGDLVYHFDLVSSCKSELIDASAHTHKAKDFDIRPLESPLIIDFVSVMPALLSTGPDTKNDVIKRRKFLDDSLHQLAARMHSSTQLRNGTILSIPVIYEPTQSTFPALDTKPVAGQCMDSGFVGNATVTFTSTDMCGSETKVSRVMSVYRPIVENGFTEHLTTAAFASAVAQGGTQLSTTLAPRVRFCSYVPDGRGGIIVPRRTVAAALLALEKVSVSPAAVSTFLQQESSENPIRIDIRPARQIHGDHVRAEFTISVPTVCGTQERRAIFEISRVVPGTPNWCQFEHRLGQAVTIPLVAMSSEATRAALRSTDSTLVAATPDVKTVSDLLERHHIQPNQQIASILYTAVHSNDNGNNHAVNTGDRVRLQSSASSVTFSLGAVILATLLFAFL